MKTIVIALFTLFLLFQSPAESALWGRTGHYITGEIAQAHLTERTKQIVEEILGTSTWEEATVWMDLVRRTPAYRHTSEWHWVTIPDGVSYEDSEKNPNGDVIEALERTIAQLKAGELEGEDKRDAVRVVIHLIGDMHQPLHVGRGDDRGGNDIRVVFLGRNTNLHSLWDTGMIESWGIGYQELAAGINLATPELISEWQSTDIRDWAMESVSYRDAVYNLPEDLVIGWEYRNKNFHIVEKRLLQAGVRIAGVLNAIFDP